MRTVSVIGCGALATVFMDNLPRVLVNKVSLKGIYSRTYEDVVAAADKYHASAYRTLEELIEERPDYVVEFAGGEAVRSYAKQILQAGINLICISVGAYADEEFFASLEKTAQASGARLFVPNGAIGGLDALQVYALMGNAQLTIENVKAPKSLEGAPYLGTRALSREAREVVFDGNVKEAIKGFPKNVNVAVAASVATEKMDANVVIISDPATKENSHTIRVKNASMRAELSFYSTPNPANPKSSSSAAWSVLALLKNLTSTVSYF